MGDFSVAMAFAYLEVVLDRGQTEDWFESNFIVGFFAVAMVALVLRLSGSGAIPIRWWRYGCWWTGILRWRIFFILLLDLHCSFSL
jgi:hypothetical protein